MFTPFKIIGLAISGKFSQNPKLQKDFQIYLILQFLNLFLACVSAFLGLARARVIFSGTVNPELFAWLFAGTWAAIAFLLLAHITDRLAFRSYGGEFGQGEGKGFIVTIIVFLVFGGLDLYMNLEGVKPASYELTRGAYSANTSPIDDRYQAQIDEQQSRIAAIDKEYTWKGNYYFAPTKWHPNFEQDKRNRDAAVAKIQELENLRDQEKQTELSMASTDATRFSEEIQMKANSFEYFTYLMYVLMAFAGFRASLYSQLVLDYFEENDYGDIPGTQEDRFGRRKKTRPGSQSPNEQQRELEADLKGQLEAITAHLVARGEMPPVGFSQNPESTNYRRDPIVPGKTGNNSAIPSDSPGKYPLPSPTGNSETVVERYRKETPDNTGKNYNTSTRTQEKMDKLTAAYYRIWNQTGSSPTQSTLAQDLNWSEKTVRKYYHMADLGGHNEQGND